MLVQPGESKSVILVSIGGKKVIRGGNGIVDGPVDDARCEEVMKVVNERAFGNKVETNARFSLSTATSFFFLFFFHSSFYVFFPF